jgi:hypothetical protein
MKKVLVGLLAVTALLLVLSFRSSRLSTSPAPQEVTKSPTLAAPRSALRSELASASAGSSPEERQTPAANGEKHHAFLDSHPVPEPASRGTTAWLVPVDRWKEAGRNSVGAAIQSQFRAISTGDTDYLRTAISLDEISKQEIEHLLEKVPVDVRTKNPTAESLAAFLLMTGPALKGYSLVAVPEKSGPDNVVVTVMTLESGAEQFNGGTQRFRRDSDGQWLRVIGAAEISRWGQMIKWDKELSKSRVWATSK